MSGNFTADGLVIRLLFTRLLGARVHIFDGDDELVISASPLKIVCGRASDAVKAAALRWVELHRNEILLMGQGVGTAGRPKSTYSKSEANRPDSKRNTI